METKYAEAGETSYSFYARVVENLKYSAQSCCWAVHNDIKIIVYNGSYVTDLCEKAGMQRIINQHKGE